MATGRSGGFKRKRSGGIRKVSWKDCVGEVAMEYAYLYPPGCPMIVPGERVSQETADMLQWYQEQGFAVEGLRKIPGSRCGSMGKIYYMMGKSASGKDTLFKEVKQAFPELRTITLYTTRPIREGERDGVEYFFVDDAALDCYESRER